METTNKMKYSIDRYINCRAAYFPTLSADGRCLAFISDITGRAQVWSIDLDDLKHAIPWPRQLTFAPDQVMYAQFSPEPDRKRLLYTHDIGGSENAQLFMLNLDEAKETCLSEGFGEAMHIPGEWSVDGKQLLFTANRRDKSQFDLYRLNPDGGETEMIWQHQEAGFLYGMIWSPNGERVALIRAAQSAKHDLFEVNLETGIVRQLNPVDHPARFATISYSRDGRYLFAHTDLDSDFLHVAKLDLATGSWEKLVHPNWDIELFAHSANGRYLAYVINQDGDSRLEVIDLATGTARPAPEPKTRPGTIGWFDHLLAFSPDSRFLAFSYASATRTSDVYLWDLDLHKDNLTLCTSSSHGGIPLSSFVAPALIHYPTFDGRQIPAWFYMPLGKDTGTAPVVVMVHGGPESQYRPYFNFLAHYLVHQGYAVLAPNVRGSTGYGNAYSHLDDVEKRMDSVADLAYAAHWLRSQPRIDAHRIAIYGGSYGGFMVLSALTTYPELWAAGVNIVGISNFVTFLENTSSYRRAHRESEYGSLAHHRDFLETISPLNQAQKISVPLMVIHGANDPRVPLSEAEQLVDVLSKRDVTAEFLVFEDEGHGIAKLKNKLVAYTAVGNFLNRVLRP
jgi:dipeptidyl aminopeptidase/acylaminoacyl peptidase